MSIVIRTQDFSHEEEYQALVKDAPRIGAIVTFCGLVREFDEGKGQALYLEHFSGMTENVLNNIIQQAKERWPIINVRIVHRIGHLDLGEQIVFVGINSAHRKAAFNACEFIMDFLKTQAPFWKKAVSHDQEYWVAAKESDRKEKDKWQS